MGESCNNKLPGVTQNYLAGEFRQKLLKNNTVLAAFGTNGKKQYSFTF